MSISFSVLGSGSRGNCTLLLLNGAQGRVRGVHGEEPHYALIDAGIAPRTTARRLGPLGVSLDQITDILLTHVDCDHCHAGWPTAMKRLGLRIRWHMHRRHVNGAIRMGVPARSIAPFDDEFTLTGRSTVQPLALPHDQLGSSGFLITHDDARLGFATDLGRVPEKLIAAFGQVDAVAIESNYDRNMQLASARPAFLKRRIMGGLGHLSNEQSLETVLAIAERCDLQQVVLLHLSQQCNHPATVKSLYTHKAPHLLGRLTITAQRQATRLLHVRPTARASVATTTTMTGGSATATIANGAGGSGGSGGAGGAGGAMGIGRQLDFLELMAGP